jgi:hypothetical protein
MIFPKVESNGGSLTMLWATSFRKRIEHEKLASRSIFTKRISLIVLQAMEFKRTMEFGVRKSHRIFLKIQYSDNLAGLESLLVVSESLYIGLWMTPFGPMRGQLYIS